METVIFLAGGKSRRMGQNKALLRLGEKTVINHLVDRFSPFSNKIVLISDQQEAYENVRVTVISDVKEFRGDGPLAGIYTGFKATNSNVCLFVACDMPFASPKIGTFFTEILTDNHYDAVIPRHDGKLHPLFGAYHKRVVPIVTDKLLSGKRKVTHLLDELNVKIVEKQDIPVQLQEGWEYCLWNMNTMEDYEKSVDMIKNFNHLI